MVRRVWLALLAMSMLTGVVVKALETEAFDAVEAELLARAALLGEDLDKDGKKLKKTYDKALKSFAKPSSSRKTDRKSVV